MVATSVEHYYEGPAEVKAVAMTKLDEWRDLLKKAALIVPLYWKIATELNFPKKRMLISIRGLGGCPDKPIYQGSVKNIRWFCSDAIGVLCVNQTIADMWKNAYHHHVYVGHSAVDLRYWYPSVMAPAANDGEKIVAGWTGNSRMKCKRVKTFFVPAMEKASSYVIPFVQCGRELSSFFKERIPWQEMAEKFYHKINVLCITSSGEGTPNPFLEALACGVPVISTPVGHVPEIMTKEGEFGWLVDTPEEMADQLIKFALSPNLRSRMREKALTKAREWSWKNKICEWKFAIEDSLKRLRDL
jgi:glycosyltransferase involved in cell wall biosynthesis